MSVKTEPSSDPFEAWRSMRDATMKAWADTMVQAVNTEAYAQATGTLLDSYLTATAPYREIVEKMMTQVLQLSNMPTRNDVIGLAERLTNLELRLDDLDAKLDGIIEQIRRENTDSRASRRAAEEGR
ncbi:MAG TPA: hypothetical protein PLA43_09930 [Bryobacteraceae bacterium]|nr:hypothetical protein [Bryobacteraceae bacterium]HOQ46298.1 hypothetical protein [Bryobacteraceae bacterium]HPQ14236.1 hypothetical protein [Bryobacteraceae bacterium]HPU72265.1 hypothetical protein [Bryobacteraceae bacterium]